MKAAGNAAVMAQRAPGDVESDDAQTALYRRLDYFPTPPWAARAGAELVQELYPAVRNVWEPACGGGHMAGPLREYFTSVKSTDIHDHGFGEVQDFLAPDFYPARWDAVMTNPPFLRAADFVRRGLIHADICAVLCRLSFLEGANRYRLFYEECCLRVVAPFAERVPMQLGSWDPALSTATAYAWFIFEAGPVYGSPKIVPIAPGAKLRLTKDTDVRRFARHAELPMFRDSASQ